MAPCFRGKGERWLPHRKGRFMYTVERLQSGCLVYQLGPEIGRDSSSEKNWTGAMR